MLALQRQLTYRRTFASMKSIIITILIVFALIPMIAKAQFNTVSGHAPRVRFTAINEKEASPESDTSQVRMPQESELPNTIKQAERTSHVSMTYPLRTIKITSPFSYRTDPFTGKRDAQRHRPRISILQELEEHFVYLCIFKSRTHSLD